MRHVWATTQGGVTQGQVMYFNWYSWQLTGLKYWSVLWRITQCCALCFELVLFFVKKQNSGICGLCMFYWWVFLFWVFLFWFGFFGLVGWLVWF